VNAVTPTVAMRALAFSPSTLDREARTVEAIASTGAPVMRLGPSGPYEERLSLDAAHVDLSRLDGAPVLNTHRQASVGDVFGTVTASRLRDGQLHVTLKFSRRPEADLVLEDIADGVLRGVSLGYSVAEWREQRGAAGALVRTAIRWTPVEVSLVPVPADPGATIRALPKEGDPMEPTTTPATDTPAPIVTRAQVNAEIRSIAQITGLEQSWTDSQIDAEATVDQARAAALEALKQRTATPIRTQTVTVGASGDDPHTRAARAGEALYARINPQHQLSEPARQFYGLTLPELARDCLHRAGHQTTGLTQSTIVTRAMHGTGDFPLILGDSVNRTIRQAYQAAPSGVRQVARMTTARDFRTKHRLQFGEGPTLELAPEGADYTHGTMKEAEETYRLETFARIIAISRQAIVNDDLGAFTDLSARMGQASAAREAAQLVSLIEGAAGVGPTMSDGLALFHADHGNLADTGAAPAEATLSAARLAMRTQTGLTNEHIAVTPRFLLVPPALETTAEKLLSQIQAAKTADVNPFASLVLIVEPRLTDAARWYVVADPAQVDGLEYCYLEGEPGPQIEQEVNFDSDGLRVKVRLDFGAGFVDHRGWYANAGA